MTIFLVGAIIPLLLGEVIYLFYLYDDVVECVKESDNIDHKRSTQ